jgi:starch-binding outer membrane protein, SusD/RagB family
MKKLIYCFLIAGVLFNTSCSDDYLETSPTNQISDQDIFKTVEGAQTVIDGVLRAMRSAGSNPAMHDQFGVKTIDLAVDLMGEDIAIERFHWFGADYQFRNRNATDFRPLYVWTLLYRIVYNVNEVINNIDNAASESENLRMNLKAQALTLRAYAYFQLVQLFQHTYSGNENMPGVPLYTEATTNGKSRNSVAEVYQMITTDLTLALKLFEESSLPQRHISNPTLNVASGIYARVALVMEDWQKAAEFASKARQGYDVMSATMYRTGFDNYKQQNWMWGLEVNNEQSTTYGSWFSHMDRTIGGYYGFGFSRKFFSKALYNQMDNEDVRKSLIDAASIESGVLISYKFAAGGDKDFAADIILMRPEEMLLIEAEARARLGEEDAARALVKQLRDRRFENPVTVTSSGELLVEKILLERRIELWAEGFAGFDIKRLKRGIDRNNSNHNPLVALTMTLQPEAKEFIYQIPQAELDANPNIGKEDQNP